MRHKDPKFKNASREVISGYSLMSVAKASRDGGVELGNDQPIAIVRSRRGGVNPKKRCGKNAHGRSCAICNPRQGRPRKPYSRKSKA